MKPKLISRSVNEQCQISLIVPTMKDSQDQSRLLELPAEMRIKIFEEIIVSNSSILINRRSWPREPALFAVCRQTREEALPLFYRLNTFHLKSGPLVNGSLYLVATWWFRHIGKAKAGMVKRLELHMGDAFLTYSSWGHILYSLLIRVGIKMATLVITFDGDDSEDKPPLP